MNQDLRIPPRSKNALTPPTDIANRLRPLIGISLALTGKTRTDGSNVRRTVCSILERYPLPPPALPGNYRILPPRGKGIPRIPREFLDTYIVTTGTSYNLQVWNRNPATRSVQIEYNEGDPLLASDVRLVLVRVHPIYQQIRAIAVLTPDYVVDRFGRFGKPTIKHQLIISPQKREKIVASSPPILFHPDLPEVGAWTSAAYKPTGYGIHDEPQPDLLCRLETMRDIVAEALIGATIDWMATKNRGQALEDKVARLLGYDPSEDELLAGDYPDIRHQALEVKVQDSPTVDLGKFSPQFEEDVPSCPGFTTASVRYLIALTDKSSGVVRGAVICPGARLGDHFSFVSDANFKCQRSIPMEFFDRLDGQAVFNP